MFLPTKAKDKIRNLQNNSGNVGGVDARLASKRRNSLFIGIVIVIIVGISAILLWQKGKSDSGETGHPAEVIQPSIQTDSKFNKRYDVIVAGTDPEGVAAAVSAARNGLKVLLVDGKNRDRLGGLITLGWLNSLDLNYSPVRSTIPGKHHFLNRGIFEEWYNQLEGTSIDVGTAAVAFQKMVQAESNIDLLIKVQSMKPFMDGTLVTGMIITDEAGKKHTVKSNTVIDATQDGDIAALAGVPFTVGREDLGNPEARMAVTLVFKMSGVTDGIWRSFGKRADTGIDKMSAWGFLAAKDYKSTDPERVGLRGLNIGRQNDDTILINAMHIFGIDPMDPVSIEEGFEIGRKEAPRIVSFLKSNFKEMRQLQYVDTAPELYFRESRHINGEYRLKMADVMQNRNFWDAIAYGSYDVDIQRLSHDDTGAIMMSPQQYGVPFRTLVPLRAEQLLVVGRSASFDSLPHGSARVIPLGMATGEAAGAAVKLAIEKGITLRELSNSKKLVAELQKRLVNQGMDLTMNQLQLPKYAKHKDYKGLLAAVSMNMTIGGYDNMRWNLNGVVEGTQYRNMMLRLSTMHPAYFKGDPETALPVMRNDKEPVSLKQAAYTLCAMAGVDISPTYAVDELLKRGWVTQETISGIADPRAITNGDSFMLVRDVVAFYAGVVYE
ncbi:FAD-dependent oxidoreductase [Paenibacillus sp. GSMTC-2017]|nr:FAD-dependent oxidoreductase [Paenibacillus sp. GSMTC-2017]